MFSNPYLVLILLTCIVILSYTFDLVGNRLKLPAVLLLLLTGIGLRQASDWFDVHLPNTKPVLELFGIIGLILIVLEGALDLKLQKEKTTLIRTSFTTALFTLLITSFAIAALLHLWLQVPFRHALINAVPLGVISSAIAIPSVASLRKEKSEFLVYESTFSDILGIMLFNFLVQNEKLGMESVVFFGASLLLILAISVVCVLVLLFFIERIRHHTKFFLILSVLMLVYALGKSLHLSSLVLVLAFGLALNNTELILRGRLKRYFHAEKIRRELSLTKVITAESAFLIRTFFFVLFGFSIVMRELNDVDVWALGMLIFTIILIVRYFYLRYIARTPIIPELFVAPRGLITILLFYSIPQHYLIPGFTHNILFVVVIMTSILMVVGLQLQKRQGEVLLPQ